MKIDSKTLAGTAILAALVVVFDYAMKYSGLKVPFPWLPILKFDFTGIPIVLSLYLFGFIPAGFTAAVAFFAIVYRSGDVVSSSMKALAELSTIVGLAFALRILPKFKQGGSFAMGILTRCFVMVFASLLVFPAYYQTPLITAFNVVQGAISILGGYFIKEAIKSRIPSLINRNTKERVADGMNSKGV